MTCWRVLSECMPLAACAHEHKHTSDEGLPDERHAERGHKTLMSPRCMLAQWPRRHAHGEHIATKPKCHAHRRLTRERMCRAAPQQFRYAECAGRMVGPSTWLFSGCVPRDDAMSAFADFVAFLAGRRAAPASADTPAGQLQHFIVGNEARAGPEPPAYGGYTCINAWCGMVCCSVVKQYCVQLQRNASLRCTEQSKPRGLLLLNLCAS